MKTSGTILIVDDEEGVRDTCRVIYEHHKYSVILCSNHLEAKEKILNPSINFQHALIDCSYNLQMNPHEGTLAYFHGLGEDNVPEEYCVGKDLANLIKQQRPEVNLYLMSGSINLLKIGNYPFIKKPFTEKDLLSIVGN